MDLARVSSVLGSALPGLDTRTTRIYVQSCSYGSACGVQKKERGQGTPQPAHALSPRGGTSHRAHPYPYLFSACPAHSPAPHRIGMLAKAASKNSFVTHGLPFLAFLIVGWYGLASVVQSKRELRVRLGTMQHTRERQQAADAV